MKKAVSKNISDVEKYNDAILSVKKGYKTAETAGFLVSKIPMLHIWEDRKEINENVHG